MRLLIIGGTKFVGRALVESGLEAGHEITLFNRGNTNPELFPEVEKLRGDRDGDLSALEGRQWDAVIDTCGYVPRVVDLSARLLADAVEHYTFISSISVYAEEVHGAASIDENAPLAKLEDETVEEVTGTTYGGLKVLCERAAEAAMPGRVLNIRPGLIVGPHDPTDRFTYWVVKSARDDAVLAPPAKAPIQVIDARDLAAWTIHMIEQRQVGIYNATGPDYPLTFGRVLEACRAAGANAAQVIHADEAFLLESDVKPWIDLPLWLPSEVQGMARVNVDRAIASGLTFRPLDNSVRDTLEWYTSHHPAGEQIKAGHSPEREAEVLTKWREKVE